MDIFTLAAAVSTGGAVVASLATTLKQKQRVIMKSQTKVELIFEQKELSRCLIMELTDMNSAREIPKETVMEMLHKLSVLSQSASLTGFSRSRINDCHEAAISALQLLPQIDRRYMYLLNKLVEGVIEAVMRTSGDKESAYNLAKTVESLAGIAPGFRKMAGSADHIAEWKNEALKKNPKK